MGHALRTQKKAGVEQFDDIDIVTILTDYLNTVDVQYEIEQFNNSNVKKGQVIFNFPKNIHQAQLLQTTGHIATRVFQVDEKDAQCEKSQLNVNRKMLDSVSEEELKSKFNTELNMHKMFIDGILDVMK